MKILQIIPTLELAGAEIMCENLTSELIKNNDVVVVSMYSIKTPITARLEKAGVKIIYLDKKPGLDIRMVGKLKRIIKTERPDVIHTHLDCLKYAGMAGRQLKVGRMIHTVHNVASKEAWGLTAKINNYYYHKYGVVPVALSDEVKDTIAKQYSLPMEQIPVIYNGINLDKCIKKEGYSSGDKLKYVHVGRFSMQKNHKMLIEAFVKYHEQYDDVTLSLVGEGVLEDECKELVKSLGAQDYIIFEGQKTEVFEILHSSDVFVLPSIYEGMPMSIIEAMGTGLPVIATMVGGIPAMLDKDEEAELIDCNKESLIEAFIRLRDENTRERYGKAGLIKAEKLFSSRSMAERYEALYRN